MRKFALVLSIAMVLGITTLVQADPIPGTLHLYDNGEGLTYDSDLDITWYAVANNTDMGWYDALNWAASLTYGGVSGWRLPNADPTCTTAPNCVKSEMGHLYYTELGNTSIGGLVNKGPFTNIQTSATLPIAYWTGTDYLPVDPAAPAAWAFNFTDGYQGPSTKVHQYYALAVHNGNIAPIPLPGAVWFLGSGLIRLLGVRRFKN